MTFRIKLLSAAALLALPAAAGAQAVQPSATPPATQTPPAGTTMEQVNQTVQQAQDRSTTLPPAANPVADEAVRQPPENAEQPVESSADVNADAQTQVQTNAQAQQPANPPAQPPANAATQSNAQVQAQANAQAAQPAGPVTAATATDLVAGVQVRDTAGGLVGTVESADADSAVVSTGAVRAEIPLASFGRNGQGLVIAMTRAQLEAAARARTPAS